jgi:hypothetical protein
LLDKTLDDLGLFMEQVGPENVHIVFDEFQEITELRDKAIEGTLRSHIQFHRPSYFFVGSRRHILLGMFSEKSRPFYQSAQLYELKKLPHDELVGYLMAQFKKGGKRCPEKNAEKISLLSLPRINDRQRDLFLPGDSPGPGTATDRPAPSSGS